MTEPIELPAGTDLDYAAQRAYMAYGEKVGWKAVDGESMRGWDALEERIRNAWKTATATVLAYASLIAERKRPSTPQLATMVHYVSCGSADGQYPPACRPAVINQVLTAAYLGSYKIDPEQAMTVGLFVMNPEGTYHLTLEGAGGCKYALARPGHQLVGGTWHWVGECSAS